MSARSPHCSGTVSRALLCVRAEQGDAVGPFECTLRTWERREARFTTAVQRRSRMSCPETGPDDFRIVRSRHLALSWDNAASPQAEF